MNRANSIKIWLLSLILFFATHAVAETVFVTSTKGRGVSSDVLETIHELVRTGVTQVSGYRLSTSRNNASYVLVPKVLRLGEAYILKIDKVQSGQVVYSNKMKSKTLSDMDAVAGRVVRSVLNEQDTRDSAQVTDVTVDEETRGTRRFKATKQWRIGFGPAWSSGLRVDGGGSSWSLGYVWGVDPDFDLKIMTAFYIPKESDEDSARFNDIHLGLNYYLTRGKSSPFVTGGVGYGNAAASEDDPGFLNLSDDEASGWMVNVGVGMKFFRTSNVNLGVLAEYAFLFDKTSKTDESPKRTTVSLAVYF